MKQKVILPPSTNPRIPEPEAPFYHELPLQIRFTDIDMLGHMNNGVYLTMMDLGKTHYFNDVLGEKVDWHKINVAVVNINVNF
ncbi:MAG: acyl-CoA thioesterase, partial [Bacteroidales bacterium]|nr:acyl-CoA thioesterase [Bacteroidales bacterium]